MAIAGRVAIVPKGDWSADATYKRLDAVTYNNTLYFAKKEVPAGTATSNTEYWSKSIVGSASAIATTEDAGVVKPDGKSMSVDESGTLSINLDGTTITLDEAKNVIKLADALKEKIGSALQPESIANNQITTVEGFALDARQANPNLDGTLAKQVADLNGSLNNIKKGGWLEHGKAISFNIYDNTSYFLFLNSAGNVYASVLSTVYDFHNTIIKNDFNDNDIEISYDHNTKAVIVKNNGNLIIDFRCI